MSENIHTLKITSLICNNPITKLSNDYNSKLIQKFNENFNTDESYVFLASFYTYLHYDSEKDFVIDLDSVWKWVGFSRKDHAKSLIEKNFERDSDYIINFAPALEEAKIDNRGGLNKEIILMNINTFKMFCLLAKTDKSLMIKKYYIKLEKDNKSYYFGSIASIVQHFFPYVSGDVDRAISKK